METAIEPSYAESSFSGPAFSAVSPHLLYRRLRPGSIAVIDLPDFDPWVADRLADAGVIAVINCSESITGRSPNVGAPSLLERGIAVLDKVGKELLDELQQGEVVTVRGSVVELRGGVQVQGVRLTKELAEARQRAACEYIGLALSKVAAAASTQVTMEWAQFFRTARVPALEPLLHGKIAAVVLGGARALVELKRLRWRLATAVVVAVEDGFEVATRVGLRPAIAIGRAASIPDAALRSDADLVVIEEPGQESQATSLLGVERERVHKLFWPGLSEDAAMVLAADCGARLVISVGSGFSFGDVVKRGERAAGAAILVRLRLGSRVVDATSLLRLHSGWTLPAWAYVGIGFIALGIVWLLLRALTGGGP